MKNSADADAATPATSTRPRLGDDPAVREAFRALAALREKWRARHGARLYRLRVIEAVKNAT